MVSFKSFSDSLTNSKPLSFVIRESVRRASAVSKTSGGESLYGPQPPRAASNPRSRIYNIHLWCSPNSSSSANASVATAAVFRAEDSKRSHRPAFSFAERSAGWFEEERTFQDRYVARRVP